MVLLLGFSLAQKTTVTAEHKNLNGNSSNYDQKGVFIQIGNMDEFVLNQGHPFKRKSGFIGSNFKIIVNY